jgi:hypothetical protein
MFEELIELDNKLLELVPPTRPNLLKSVDNYICWMQYSNNVLLYRRERGRILLRINEIRRRIGFCVMFMCD